MARGNRDRVIFEDDKDRLRLVVALGEARGKTGCCLHAYVLMNKHYHLLAQTHRDILLLCQAEVRPTPRFGLSQ